MTAAVHTNSLFVTGGGGYLGRRFLARLDAGRYEKVLCLKHRSSIPDLPGIDVVEGDLGDPATYRDHLGEGTTVVHLAALTGKGSRAEHFRVNDEATRTLLAAATEKKAQGFLLVSTVAAAFSDRGGYHYADAKQAAEEAVLAAELPSLVVRPTMIFGPGAPVLDGLRKLALAPIVPVFGGGARRCQPVHVDDMAAWLSFALELLPFDGSIHTVGGAERLSLRELLNRIRQKHSSKSGGLISFPLAPTRLLLRLLEPLLLPILPLTAGQLASFANDSTVPDQDSSQGRDLLQTPVEEMI